MKIESINTSLPFWQVFSQTALCHRSQAAIFMSQVLSRVPGDWTKSTEPELIYDTYLWKFASYVLIPAWERNFIAIALRANQTVNFVSLHKVFGSVYEQGKLFILLFFFKWNDTVKGVFLFVSHSLLFLNLYRVQFIRSINREFFRKRSKQEI